MKLRGKFLQLFSRKSLVVRNLTFWKEYMFLMIIVIGIFLVCLVCSAILALTVTALVGIKAERGQKLVKMLDTIWK